MHQFNFNDYGDFYSQAVSDFVLQAHDSDLYCGLCYSSLQSVGAISPCPVKGFVHFFCSNCGDYLAMSVMNPNPYLVESHEDFEPDEITKRECDIVKKVLWAPDFDTTLSDYIRTYANDN